MTRMEAVQRMAELSRQLDREYAWGTREGADLVLTELLDLREQWPDVTLSDLAAA